MGKKDYSDYIEWCYDQGYDPADYDDFAAFQADIIDNNPPIHYDGWEPHSQNALKNSLKNFFTKVNRYVTIKEENPRSKVVNPVEELKAVNKAQDQTRSTRRQLRKGRPKTSTGARTQLTKTQEKTIEAIQNKRLRKAKGEKVKLSKVQRSELRRAVGRRAWELESRFGYDKSRSMKRANQELNF